MHNPATTSNGSRTLDYISEQFVFIHMINNESCDTHLDEAREKSGFLNPICDMEKLQDGEQLAQTHHKANRVKCVC